MKYRKILMIAIGLISVFVLMGTAQAFNWYGFSDLCFEGEIKSPAGDVVCTVTLEEVTIATACDNINSAEPSGECKPGEAHTADLVQTIYPDGEGTKDRKFATVEGCFNFSIYDNHLMHEYEPLYSLYHSCDPASKNLWEIVGSAHIESFVAKWECKSVTTGNIIGVGRDTCTWDGTVDPETCLPSHSDGINPDFTCTEEVFGKKWTWE